MSRHMPIIVLVLMMAAPICFGTACPAGDSKSKGLSFAPEFHFDEDLHMFFNQDSVFRQRYFIEWNSSAELAFLSYDNRFFFFGEMEATVGLGRWPNKAILFDPNQMDIGFGPLFEYRFAPVNLDVGLDHHCFHEIDTLDSGLLGPVYWNKVALNASSPQFRPGAFKEAIAEGSDLSWKTRLAWQAGIAYTLHDFFGVDTSIVGWNQTYMVDLTGEVKCAVYRFKGIAAIADAKTGAYITRTNQTLWNQQLRAELLATQGKFGLDLFVNWVVVDQLPPRQNKDKLVAVGIDGFY